MPGFLVIVGVILLLTNPPHVASLITKKPATDSFSDFLSLISNVSYGENHPNEAILKCPELWSKTRQEFQDQEKSGRLGSSDKLQELCPSQKEELSSVCRTTIGISNYVCRASLNGNHHLPEVKDLKNLTDVKGLCKSLVGNTNFTFKLCDIIKTRLNSATFMSNVPSVKETVDAICTVSNSNLKEMCEEHCAQQNHQLCKTILQSLRTIVSWEEEKEMSDSMDTTDPGVNSLQSTLSQVFSTSNSSTKAQITTAQAVPKNVTNFRLISNIQNSNMTTTSLIVLPTSASISAETTPKPLEITTNQDRVQNKTNTTIDNTSTIKYMVSEDLEDGSDLDLDAVDRPPVSEDVDQHESLFDDDDDADKEMEKPVEKITEHVSKPLQSFEESFELDNDPVNTHFIFYFIAFVILSVCGYLMFIRRKHIIALVVEGRTGSRRRSISLRERPSSGSYRKLVNNLEEVISSDSVKNTNVIY